MKSGTCPLCGEPIEAASDILCPACAHMDARIDTLVEKRPEQLRLYLVAKHNATIYREPQLSDRRTKPYNPPWGKHTPDRRVRIRRLDEAPESPKRRKSDT
jgi:predicted DsbA family dithiol-disulfide isomerase